MTFWSKLTEGAVKAMGMLIAEPKKKARKRKEKPKFIYTRFGSAVHARTTLNPIERKDLGIIIKQINDEDDKDLRAEHILRLRAMPVKFVEVKRAERQDYSRYTGDDIREINKLGGGPKEQARAVKRKNAMAIASANVALAA